jgi:transketolase
MLELKLIPFSEFERIRLCSIEEFAKLALVADMCRANAFVSVKKAGSGHLGSSFSAMDIVVSLYYKEMNTIGLGLDHPDRDIYFSSKGHDVPGLYSVLYSLGILPREKILKLRRLGGLDGHPDVKIPGIEANSGSLGMGVSKARGMAYAKRMRGNQGRIFVLTGDGELQEGQIYEALQTTLHQKINDLIVVVDHNKVQSDKSVSEITDLGNLEEKFRAFGWHVARCDGHDFQELARVLAEFRGVSDKPKILIADTIKGKGISFMEHPQAFKDGKGLYKWHAGAPDDDSFDAGFAEILGKINGCLNGFGLNPISLEVIETREKGRVRLKDVAEKVVNAYGEALVELGKKRKDIIVLDADLSDDCGLRPFENAFHERFVENGIAEQDMVSMAGGLALQGFLPIVNSFGVFLASRANEQIYTNATEGTKIIYVCHYAGLIPAGPGKSHQSLRDISLFGALPNCVILEPCNAVETKAALEWCVNDAKENCMLRLVISPSPRTIQLPENYDFTFGKGAVLRDGKDAAIFAYGPVMLHEALLASELLFVLDNHFPYGGLGDCLSNTLIASQKLRTKKFQKFAIEEYPACGTPKEALKYHKLDGESLAERVLENIQNC